MIMRILMARRATILLATGVVGGGLTGGCATADPEKAGPSTTSEECMFSTSVDDWAPIDKQTFVIYGPGRQDAFLARLAYPTVDLTQKLGMSVIDDDHNGRICGQSMDSVAFRDATIPGKIFITSMKKITREEARALIAEGKKEADKKEADKPK